MKCHRTWVWLAVPWVAFLGVTGCAVSGGFNVGGFNTGGTVGNLPTASAPAPSKIVRAVMIPAFGGVGVDGTREGMLMIGDHQNSVTLLSGITLAQAEDLVESVGRELILQPEHGTAVYDVYIASIRGIPTPGPYLYFDRGVFIGFVPPFP